MQSEAATQVQITRLDNTNPTALYRHYDGELEPQPCFVSLDLADGELAVDWNGEIGNSVPESVWNDRVIRWGIPCLTAKDANRFLDTIAPIAQRVIDGASIEWDGNNNVGHLTEDAETASVEIADLCGGLNDSAFGYARIVEYSAADWYSEGEQPTVTATMTDDELEALAERLQAEDGGSSTGQTMTDNPADYIVLAGLDDYLEALRATAREVVEDELSEVADDIDKAVLRRDELIRMITWKPSREVGQLSNLSHTRVQQIAAK